MDTVQLSNNIDETCLIFGLNLNQQFAGKSFAEIAQELKSASRHLSGFAEACYDQNSTDELIESLKLGADKTDCKTWGIDDDQWQEAVKTALYAQWYDNLYRVL